MDILQAIGNTSIVQLRKVAPPDCADIFAKLEWENTTHSKVMYYPHQQGRKVVASPMTIK